MVLLHGNLDIVAYEARTTRVSRRKHNTGRYLPKEGCFCWTADPWEADSGYFLSAYAGALHVAADRALVHRIGLRIVAKPATLFPLSSSWRHGFKWPDSVRIDVQVLRSSSGLGRSLARRSHSGTSTTLCACGFSC